MAGEDFIGSDLPAMSAEQEAAFAAEESAAKSVRVDTKGFNRLTPELPGDEPDDAPAVPAQPAAPAAAPATPAAPAAPVVDPDEDGITDAVLAQDGKKYLPVAAHVQMRKSLQGQLKDAQTIIEEGNKRLNQLFEMATKNGAPGAQPAAAAAPVAAAPETNPFDKTTHPLENLEWENQRLAKRVGELADWRTATTEQTQQQAALASARGAYVSLHKGFEAQNPAYGSAYRHAMDTWTNVHKAMGMNHQEAVAKANEAEWAVVQEATKRNQHPSQVIMEIAKAAGWNPATAGAAAPAGGPAAPVAPTPAAQIKLAQEGAAAAVSLSDASGGSAPQPMTLSTLASMSKEDFHAATSGQKGEELFRKMAMGRGRGGSAAA